MRAVAFGSWDHPRTRGEKPLNIAACMSKAGSPPHTRGKALRKKVKTILNRITPAHAGKSLRYPARFLCSWDHPRTRGEKCFSASLRYCTSGSPPHTRGKEIRKDGSTRHPGITPAHAGKRAGAVSDFAEFEDHPRTRGEKVCTKRTVEVQQGSPPHTRGKGFSLVVLSSSSRITPAHAGKRLNHGEPFARVEDHPRTRGEKLLS